MFLKSHKTYRFLQKTSYPTHTNISEKITLLDFQQKLKKQAILTMTWRISNPSNIKNKY